MGAAEAKQDNGSRQTPDSLGHWLADISDGQNRRCAEVPLSLSLSRRWLVANSGAMTTSAHLATRGRQHARRLEQVMSPTKVAPPATFHKRPVFSIPLSNRSGNVNPKSSLGKKTRLRCCRVPERPLIQETSHLQDHESYLHKAGAERGGSASRDSVVCLLPRRGGEASYRPTIPPKDLAT